MVMGNYTTAFAKAFERVAVEIRYFNGLMSARERYHELLETIKNYRSCPTLNNEGAVQLKRISLEQVVAPLSKKLSRERVVELLT